MPFLVRIPALLTGAFVAGLWQGLALAAMGIALCSLMSHASARLRHTILVALFTGALMLPWVHVYRPASIGQSHGLQLTPWVAAVVALLWLSALLLRAFQLYLAWRHLCKVRRNATPVQVQGSDVFHGGSRRAVLCSSPDVDSPSILGLGSPRLLLPAWMIPNLSEAELHQIALHECEHLRRGDDWLNLLLQIGITLSPLNPALLWLNRSICMQRELAADAAVVAHTAQPLTYAACLTRLAEQHQQRGRLRLALAAWERQSELAQRVYVLLDRSSRWTRNQSAWAAGAGATALLLAATGMACAPQFVHIGHSATNLVADQELGTVVPTRRSFAMPQGRAERVSAQMVPPSFPVPPHPSATLQTRRKKIQAGNVAIGCKATSQCVNTFGMLRTAAVLPRRPLAARGASAQTYELPHRLITAEFGIPYLAVPTHNGWLLIEL